MRLLLAFLFTSFFSSFLSAQNLSAIRSDIDLLNFVRSMPYKSSFRFDTSYQKDFLQMPGVKTIPKTWNILDLNNDKKPDMYYTGYSDNLPFVGHTVTVLLSSDTGYEKHYLMRSSSSCCDQPVIIPVKKGNETMLSVFMCTSGGVRDWDSIIGAAKNKYPSCVRWVDTLVWRNGNFVNYHASPSRINFDSLEYQCHAGMLPVSIKLVLYKNGGGILTEPFDEPFTKIKDRDEIIAPKYEYIQSIRELISSMDMNMIRKKYVLYKSDQVFVSLKIYSGKSVYSFEDVGAESDFTLMTLYQYFHLISRDAHWPYNQ